MKVNVKAQETSVTPVPILNLGAKVVSTIKIVLVHTVDLLMLNQSQKNTYSKTEKAILLRFILMSSKNYKNLYIVLRLSQMRFNSKLIEKY